MALWDILKRSSQETCIIQHVPLIVYIPIYRDQINQRTGLITTYHFVSDVCDFVSESVA